MVARRLALAAAALFGAACIGAACIGGASSPLVAAAKSGDTARAVALLEAAPKEQRASALCAAASANKAETLARLLDGGIDPNASRAGVSALHCAARSDSAEALRVLISRGAEPNPVGPGGRTPLMEAAEKSSAKVVRALLDAGANKALRDHGGRDARAFAEMYGRRAIVETLDAVGERAR